MKPPSPPARTDASSLTTFAFSNTPERDEESGCYAASWDAPRGKGGIATQGRDLRELEANAREAVACYFDEGKAPRSIRLHFVDDPVLTPA